MQNRSIFGVFSIQMRRVRFIYTRAYADHVQYPIPREIQGDTVKTVHQTGARGLILLRIVRRVLLVVTLRRQALLLRGPLLLQTVYLYLRAIETSASWENWVSWMCQSATCKKILPKSLGESCHSGGRLNSSDARY